MVTFTGENRPPESKKRPGRHKPSRAKGNTVYLAAAFLGLKIKYDVEKALLDKLTNLTNNLYDKLKTLENYLSEAKKINNISKSSVFFRDKVFACIEEMRPIIDELERTVSKKYWKLPTYGDMLYSLA